MFKTVGLQSWGAECYWVKLYEACGFTSLEFGVVAIPSLVPKVDQFLHFKALIDLTTVNQTIGHFFPEIFVDLMSLVVD
jgi:hypothetical protein